MGFSSKKWAEIVSKVASLLCFYIIIVQIPLFRFPCRMGTCQTPVEVMVCQLIASEILPEFAMKALLYPRVLKTSLLKGTTIPSPDQLLDSYKFRMKKVHASTDLKHLEVIAGSYLSVVGALLGLLRRGRMSFFGLILILWGITRQMLAIKHESGSSSKSLSIFPVMIITIVIAFFSMRRDVRKLIKCFRPGWAKRLKHCSKAKYR